MEPGTDAPGAGRISGLVPDPLHPGSVRVQVDGRTLLTVREAVLERLGMGVGSPVRGPAEDALCHEADAEAAYRALLRMLERRPFAARDIGRRLVLRGHPPAAADAAVARAGRAGLLDDEAFTRHYIQTRSARGRGPSRLRRELAGMGVPESLVDRLLLEELPDGSAPERVLSLAEKRAAQLPGIPRAEHVRRVIAFLARRGHTGPEVRRLARQAVATVRARAGGGE